MSLNLFYDFVFAIHGGGDAIIVIMNLLDRLLGFIELLASLSGADLYHAIFPGLAAIKNLHPVFVHFPIALLLVFFVIDLASTLFKNENGLLVAQWLLYLGTFFTAITIATGLIAAHSLPHNEEIHKIIEVHQALGLLILTTATILSVWRSSAGNNMPKPMRWSFHAVSTFLCLLILFAADMGGLMVYKYGVSIDEMDKIHAESNAHHQHSGTKPETLP